MELKVINDKGEKQASVAASETLFGRDYNEALVHQVVVAYQANAREGTRAQLDRGEVKHSTKKPFRQRSSIAGLAARDFIRCCGRSSSVQCTAWRAPLPWRSSSSRSFMIPFGLWLICSSSVSVRLPA